MEDIINFALGVKPMIMPFTHDPAGYKALLMDAQAQYKAISEPVQAMTERFEENKERFSAMLKMGTMQAQALFNRVQSRMVNR